MQEASTDIDVNSLCLKKTVLSIEDPEASPEGSRKGWMTQDDWGAELRKINASAHPYVKVGVDGELSQSSFFFFSFVLKWEFAKAPRIPDCEGEIKPTATDLDFACRLSMCSTRLLPAHDDHTVGWERLVSFLVIAEASCRLCNLDMYTSKILVFVQVCVAACH